MIDKGKTEQVLAATDVPQVLVVEDDPVSAKLILRLLSQEGIKGVHASDAKQALEMFHREHYRLVVSDWIMPEVSGVELCRSIRQIPGSYTYFILCTAKGERGDRLHAYDAGIDDFLNKPLDRDEFRSRLLVARRVLQMEDDLNAKRVEIERAHEVLQEANSNLLIASRRFAELFNGLPVACFTFDESGTIHEWNRAAESQFGIPSFKAFLQPVHEVLGTHQNEFWTVDRVDEIVYNLGAEEVEWTYYSAFGVEKHFVTTVFVLKSDRGQFVGAIAANQDITEREISKRQIEDQMSQINFMMREVEVQKRALQEANAKLVVQADTDGLTGLLNHRRFQGDLEQTFNTCRESGKPLSVVLLDVDYFKKYNDTYGHQCGDDVLRQFASLLLATCRRNEAVARYGGEEFAIILENCPKEPAIKAADRFREAIEKATWTHRPITASFGVSTLTAETPSPKELLIQADQALYRSKELGRNCVTHFSEMDERQQKAA